MFTKGEWKVNQPQTGGTTITGHPFAGGKDWDYATVNVGQETIAVCPNQCSSRVIGEQSEQIKGSGLANANLIKAAPDMYEALKHLIACMEDMIYELKVLPDGDINQKHVIEDLNKAKKTLAKADGK